MFTAPGIFDTRKSANINILMRNIKLIAEVLTKQVFKEAANAKLDVASHSLAVSRAFVDNWLTFFASQARVSPLLEKKNPVLLELDKVLYLGRTVENIKTLVFTCTYSLTLMLTNTPFNTGLSNVHHRCSTRQLSYGC